MSDVSAADYDLVIVVVHVLVVFLVPILVILCMIGSGAVHGRSILFGYLVVELVVVLID